MKLRKRLFRRIGGKRGFTLIELLIVLTILAILAAVVVLALTGFIGRGKTQACEAEQSSLQIAAYTYYYENNGSWPTADGTAGKVLDYTKLVPNYIDGTPQYDDAGADDCDWEVDEDVVGVVCAGAAAANCPCKASVPVCAD